MSKKAEAEKPVSGATTTKPTPTEKAEAAAKRKAAVEAKAKEKADAKAAAMKERQEAAAKKKAEKDKEKAAKATPKDGVIHTIAQCITRPHGASKAEILDTLGEKFPDKDVDKMKTTVGIQLTRLAKVHDVTIKRKKEDEEGGRGLVYLAPAKLLALVEKRSIRVGRVPAKA